MQGYTCPSELASPDQNTLYEGSPLGISGRGGGGRGFGPGSVHLEGSVGNLERYGWPVKKKDRLPFLAVRLPSTLVVWLPHESGPLTGKGRVDVEAPVADYNSNHH